jgi:CRP-like cAMP-binding protein
MSDSNLPPIANLLLAALPPEDYRRLAPHLEPVPLTLHKVLYQQGAEVTHAYFPSDSMISLVAVIGNKRIEIGVVGREGMISTSSFMGTGFTPFEAMVQLADGAMRMEAHILKEEFDRGGAIQQLLLKYAQPLYIQGNYSF